MGIDYHVRLLDAAAAGYRAELRDLDLSHPDHVLLACVLRERLVADAVRALAAGLPLLGVAGLTGLPAGELKEEHARYKR